MPFSSCQSDRVTVHSNVVFPASVDNASSSPGLGSVGTAMRFVNRTAELSMRRSGSLGARTVSVGTRIFTSISVGIESGGLDVLRPRPLRTLADVKGDALAFAQIVEP